MTNKTIYVGIDVSKKELVVAGECGKSVWETSQFSNNSKGQKALCRFLRKKKGEVYVCLEATGIYSLDVALELHEVKNVSLMVANPRAVRNFAKAMMNRGKTDPMDAAVIREFVKRMPFQEWEAPTKEELTLRDGARRIESLKRTLAAEKNRLNAAQSSENVAGMVREDIKENIAELEKRIDRLSNKCVCHIEKSTVLKKMYEQLMSVTGIAETSAVRILAELCVLPKDMDVRQLVAYAGLDPRKEQSGSSLNKPTRISKAGNVRLRSALYMPALVAARHEKHIKGFYDHLLEAGKKPMQATVAVMRKLLHAIYGMFKTGTMFKGDCFYKMPAA